MVFQHCGLLVFISAVWICALFNAAPLKLVCLVSETVSTLDSPSSRSRQRASLHLSWSNGSPNDLFWSCKKVPPTYLFYWSINRFLGSFSGVSGSVNRYEDRLQTLFWSNLTDTTLCKIDTGPHFRTTPHGTTDSDMRVRTQCAPVTFMLAEPRAYKQ